MIFYDKRTGLINAIAPSVAYAYYYDQDLKDNLEKLVIENPPKNIFDYRVVDGGLVKKTEAEINELRLYGRILSEEERLENSILDKLKPSYDEIKKAENTIEILKLMQEAMTNE